MTGLASCRVLVDCECGVSFEADSSNAELITAACDHRARCGRGLEWWLLTEHMPVSFSVSVGFVSGASRVQAEDGKPGSAGESR